MKALHNSDEDIYVQHATLDGKAIDRAYITVDELLQGGTLTLTMGRRPSDWARKYRPPSYRPER